VLVGEAIRSLLAERIAEARSSNEAVAVSDENVERTAVDCHRWVVWATRSPLLARTAEADSRRTALAINDEEAESAAVDCHRCNAVPMRLDVAARMAVDWKFCVGVTLTEDEPARIATPAISGGPVGRCDC
jgi:hypothetical protein